jgi:ectoine hydroxylase-related dioxygenase (phytanoyl-CoA dioxygenase family)
MSDTPRLTPEQVEHYLANGYVLYHQPVLTAEKFNALFALFEECRATYGDEGMDMIHLREPRFLDYLLDDEILDVVEPLVGPNIGLWASHIICKPPFTGKATPWHEDSAYWNGRVSTMEGICTLWLAFDEATPENGSMGVIPGSHKNGFSEYEAVDATQNIFASQVRSDQFDEGTAVYFSLKPNECSLHEARIIHGANANTSPKRRAGYTMRYFPTTSLVYHDNPRNANHKIWLARGKDIAGNRYENG